MKLATLLKDLAPAPPPPVELSSIARALLERRKDLEYKATLEAAANAANTARDLARLDVGIADKVESEIAAVDQKLAAALAQRYAGNGSDAVIAALKAERARLDAQAAPLRERASEARQALPGLQAALDASAARLHAAIAAPPAAEYQKWAAIAREKFLPQAIAAAEAYFLAHSVLQTALDEADKFANPGEQRPKLAPFASPRPLTLSLVNGPGGVWSISTTPESMAGARERMLAMTAAIVRVAESEIDRG